MFVEGKEFLGGSAVGTALSLPRAQAQFLACGFTCLWFS